MIKQRILIAIADRLVRSHPDCGWILAIVQSIDALRRQGLGEPIAFVMIAVGSNRVEALTVGKPPEGPETEAFDDWWTKQVAHLAPEILERLPAMEEQHV